MRILRILGIVLVSAVVAAAITTVVLVVRRPDQVGRGPIATGGSGGGSLAAVQRALPAVVRVQRGGPGGAGGGTGVIVDPRGYVLTAEALVAGAESLSVAVQGARTVPARVVGSDPDDGLTILKIDSSSLRTLAMGGATAADTGSGVVLVAAAGYPQVAVGAVASAHVSVTVGDPAAPGATRSLNDVMALDVASRDGQLGAPVLDAGGRLVGLVVRAGNQLYAADMTQAQASVQQLVDSGHTSLPSLGFTYQQLSASDAADLDVPGGVRVLTLEPRASAQGLSASDIVLAANGTPLDPSHPLARLLRGLAVKQTVTLDVRAPGTGSPRRTITLDVQLVSP